MTASEPPVRASRWALGWGFKLASLRRILVCIRTGSGTYYHSTTSSRATTGSSGFKPVVGRPRARTTPSAASLFAGSAFPTLPAATCISVEIAAKGRLAALPE